MDTISVLEAGKRLGLSKNTIYRAVQNGAVPALRFGRAWRVPVAALKKLLENPTGNGTAASAHAGADDGWRIA